MRFVLAHLPHARPEEIGFDSQRLEVAYDLLESWTTGADAAVPGATVPDAAVPGGAILVGGQRKTVAPRFFGRQGPEPDAGPIRKDGMFLLASISKPVTYIGALMLVERGLLNLSDPVARYIPDFAAHHKEEVLVQHLFTHTSGLPDMLDNNVELRRAHAPLKKFIEGAIRDTKLLFEPGTDYSYQSMGTLVVAEIVQRISGMAIADYLKREIFAPLGMNDTALGSRGLDESRLVRVETPEYQGNADFGWNGRYWREFGAPWGGLFSSPEDFAILCDSVVAGGVHRQNGKEIRLLSPATVEMMSSNRLDDYPRLPEPIRRTQPWGLGWRMNHPGTPGSWSDLLGRHVFGHTGATGTMCWIDPVRGRFCLLFTTALRANAPWRLVHLSNVVASAMT